MVLVQEMLFQTAESAIISLTFRSNVPWRKRSDRASSTCTLSFACSNNGVDINYAYRCILEMTDESCPFCDVILEEVGGLQKLRCCQLTVKHIAKSIQDTLHLADSIIQHEATTTRSAHASFTFSKINLPNLQLAMFHAGHPLTFLFQLTNSALPTRTLANMRHIRLGHSCSTPPDLVIETEESCIYCHKLFVSSQSDVFKAMFTNNMIENITNTVRITDYSSAVVEGLFRCMYHTRCAAAEVAKNGIDLLAIALKYNVTSVLDSAEPCISRQLNTTNVVFVLWFAEEFSFPRLANHAISYIRMNKDAVLAENGTELIGTELLVELSQVSAPVSDRGCVLQ